MKGHLQRSCELDQRTRGLNIDPPIRPQNSEDRTSCTKLLDVQNVSSHNIDLGRRVHEVATTRPHEYMHGKSAPLHCIPDKSVARSNSALAEPRAKFNAVRSALSRGKARVDRLGAEFKYQLLHLARPASSINGKNMHVESLRRLDCTY
jgi:hypothetical protein